MKNLNRISRLYIGVILLAVIFSACKESTTISANQVPSIDSINTTQIPDTHTIYTRTVLIDTMNTSVNYASLPIIHALGTVVDPFFGTTSAGVYFQVLPPSNSFNFPADIDSAFIIMPINPYNGYVWGDSTNNHQRYTAYRVTENLSKDAIYNSAQTKQLDRTYPLNEPYTADTKMFDSISVLGTNRQPHIRLKLRKEFIQEIKQNTPNLPTSADFLNYLRGIYIEPDENINSSSLPYVVLDGPNNYSRAAIEFFYQQDGATKNTFFSFLRGETVHYNYIKRNYTPQALAYLDTNKTDAILLQNQPGMAIDVILPNIKRLPLGIINSARLTITKVTLAGQVENPKLTEPNQLIIYGVDPKDNRYLLSEGVDFNDGAKRTVTVNGLEVTQYYFNIPNHIQKAIVGQWEKVHLRILGAIGKPAAYRLIAGGREHATYKTQLNIYYSKPQ